VRDEIRHAGGKLRWRKSTCATRAVGSDGRGGRHPLLGESIRSSTSRREYHHTDAELSPNGWRAVIESISMACLFARIGGAPIHEQKSGGAIIKISCDRRRTRFGDDAAYGASKAGVINLTTSTRANGVRRGFG